MKLKYLSVDERVESFVIPDLKLAVRCFGHLEHLHRVAEHFGITVLPPAPDDFHRICLWASDTDKVMEQSNSRIKKKTLTQWRCISWLKTDYI